MFSKSNVISCGSSSEPPGTWRGWVTQRPRQRPTIAVLMDYMTLFAGGYEKELREAFDAAARQQGVDLLCVYGRPIAHPDTWSAAHNVIYRLIHAERVDGVVSMSSSLSSFIGPQGMRAFLDNYRPLALCSAGILVPGVPSVVVDNRAGMMELLSHLIRDHGARRIAFIGGPIENPDAEARLSAYRDALDAHGLSFDSALVGVGDFVRRSGTAVMDAILERAGTPDAVVAANDSMALGAISSLKSHGLRVPRDVLVTGFDDLEQARLADPPLTTVGQPIARLAEHSLKLVLAQLAQQAVPECSVLPPQFISRRSCGCTLRATQQAVPRQYSQAQRPELQRVSSLLSERERLQLVWGHAARLLEPLQRELSGESQAFMAALEELLDAPGSDNEHHQRLQVAITRLREELRDVATSELEDLWDEARTRIALSNTQTQVQRRLEHDETYHRLIEHGERLSTALDLHSLKAVLESTLPALGVRNAHISRYSDGAASELQLFVGVHEGRAYQASEARFSARLLFPPDAEAFETRRTLLAFPLVFEAQSLGVAVFEYIPGMNGWQVIRDQISAALRSVLLHHEIVEQATQHERNIREQERLSTAKRLQSLSVLAGGVAHDLNNVLGPLVALPDVILHELERQDPSGQVLTQQMRTDMGVIRSAALRAAQTIKDLLTLSQSGQTAKEPLDLNEVIAGCVSQDSLGYTREARPAVDVRLELSPESLFVAGSPAQLTRVITNLLRNAMEAIEREGQVRIQTLRARLIEPIHGYETVPPGDYAAVIISDTGNGIPPEDIGRIFEPFFSSKRLGEQSGSGLGLAIVRGVVKEHGGFIDLLSTPARGTTFTVYFPRVASAPARPAKKVELKRGNGRILIVDDEPVQLRAASRVLSQLGYQVETCKSGSKAYQLFVDAHSSSHSELNGATQRGQRSPYDLVIFDMLLNEAQDGLQVLLDIEQLFPQQKAIIASGHASNERAALAARKGICWLSKPYTSAALAHAVQAALVTVERPSAWPSSTPQSSSNPSSSRSPASRCPSSRPSKPASATPQPNR